MLKGVEIMEKRNLNIFGSGSQSGGHYGKVKITGEGTVTDDLDCELFKTHGTSVLLGNVKANHFAIYGTADLQENLKSNLIKIFGTLDVSGDIFSEKMVIRGTGDVGGNIQGEVLDVKGGLSIKGNCEVETFQLEGGFQIDGLLNAGNIQIGMKYDGSNAEEIGGETINIRKKNSFFSLNKNQGKLTAQVIEGDSIYLEHTKAKVVRGKDVEIGPGCEIDLVEYKESFKQHKTTKVKNNKKL